MSKRKSNRSSRSRGSSVRTVSRGKAAVKRGRKSFPEFTGTAKMTRDGFIIVSVEGRDDDIFIKATKTRGALHGDTVRVAVTKARTADRRSEGEVVEIVERSRKPFVGVLHMVGKQAWVLMSSRTMPYDIAVEPPHAADFPDSGPIRSGLKVAAVVDGWERGDSIPYGHIVDILGKAGENDTEMHAILSEFGLPYRFSREVEKAAEEIPDAITDKERKGRRDFRNTLTFTIDPTDAKDFDDALSLRRLDNGNFEVGIHIADVTWYVRPGSILDKEASERGTSVYLVDRTVPMLPEKLSNRLCSLRPHEEKLTFSAVFELTPLGKVINPWFGRTMIESDWRFDYQTAQSLIDGTQVPDVPADITEALLALNGLAQKLRKKRFASGAISFDRPEMKVEVDAEGRPVGVHRKVSGEANWLIEEFMLLANRYVAEYVASDGHFGGKAVRNPKTFVYRVHDEPNYEKLGSLRTFAGNLGYKLGDISNGPATAKSLNSLLTDAKDKPEYGALQLIALRSMARACYSTENIGHYGLAFKFYTHFTSPIRRYPDMMVHRLLAAYLAGKESADRDFYEDRCKHSSEREVIASEAERESIKYKLVEFMGDKIGQEFDGSVSSLTEWGMYVEIEPTGIEGMVPLREIRSDFFVFDEENYRIIGRRTGRQYRLGDKVRIRVKATNLDQKLLDYELVEEGV